MYKDDIKVFISNSWSLGYTLKCTKFWWAVEFLKAKNFFTLTSFFIGYFLFKIDFI